MNKDRLYIWTRRRADGSLAFPRSVKAHIREILTYSPDLLTQEEQNKYNNMTIDKALQDAGLNESLYYSYVQLLEQLDNETQVGAAAYILYQGVVQGALPSVNFSLFTLLAYQRFPEYIDKFLKRLVGKSFSELKEEGLAIMKAENIN